MKPAEPHLLMEALEFHAAPALVDVSGVRFRWVVQPMHRCRADARSLAVALLEGTSPMAFVPCSHALCVLDLSLSRSRSFSIYLSLSLVLTHALSLSVSLSLSLSISLYCVVALSQASCAYSPAQADVASTPAVHAVHGRSDRAQAGSQRLGLRRVRRDADAVKVVRARRRNSPQSAGTSGCPVHELLAPCSSYTGVHRLRQQLRHSLAAQRTFAHSHATRQVS